MKKFLLVSVCSIVLFGTAVQAMRFEDPAIFSTGMKRRTKFLSVHNQDLDKALEIHNLMTEIPGLKIVFAQQEKMQKSAKTMEEYQNKLQKCNEMRFGRFKNSKDVLAKVRQAYKKETQNLESSFQDKNSVVPTAIASRSKQYLRRKEIEKKIVSDALTNGKKWGGESVNKKQKPLPENLDKDIYGTGLEELAIVDEGVTNAKVAMSDYEKSANSIQQSFVKKLETLGIVIPEFDGRKDADMRRAHEELKKKKQESLDAAKAYINKLDEQDAKYPELVARRESRSKNKQIVMKSVQERYPGEFNSLEKFDQKTPQDRQRMLINALEKDAEGTVFLTETSALEIDQKMAEMKSTENLISTFQMKADEFEEMQSDSSEIENFDFSRCSG